jgi:molecular chaperone GrpE
MSAGPPANNDTPMSEPLQELRADSPTGAATPLAEQLTPIITHIAGLEEKFAKLQTCFEERLQYDAAKEKAFDVLHAKLCEQNTDQGAALKKNLVLALFRLHDHMQEAEADLEEGSMGRQRLAELRVDLIDILYAEDVEPIEVPSDEFDRSRQRALGTTPTNNPALSNTVEKVVYQGFVSGSRVLRPQGVIVRRYQPLNKEESEKGA